MSSSACAIASIRARVELQPVEKCGGAGPALARARSAALAAAIAALAAAERRGHGGQRRILGAGRRPAPAARAARRGPAGRWRPSARRCRSSASAIVMLGQLSRMTRSSRWTISSRPAIAEQWPRSPWISRPMMRSRLGAVIGNEPAGDLAGPASATIRTASPRSKLPSRATTPAGSRLLPLRSACSAPSST